MDDLVKSIVITLLIAGVVISVIYAGIQIANSGTQCTAPTMSEAVKLDCEGLIEVYECCKYKTTGCSNRYMPLIASRCD